MPKNYFQILSVPTQCQTPFLLPNTEEEFKQCATCKEFKKANLQFFYKRKESRDGFKSSCKLCLISKSKKSFIKNSAKVKERAKIYRSENKEKIAEAQKKWRLENKDWIENYNESHQKEACKRQKKYRDNLSLDKKAELKKENAIRSAKWRKENPSYMVEYLKKYRETNQEKVSAFQRNYKARKKEAHGSHTGEDVIYIMEKQNHLCFWCGIKLVKIHVDHYIPLFRGGSNDKTNLVASCPKCNQSKGSKMPSEFILYQQLKQ